MAEKQSVLKEVSNNISFIRDSMAGRYGEKHPEWAWVYELLADYYEGACRAKEKGEPLAWVNFGVISELFWAMDIVPVVIDVVTGLTAPTAGAIKYIDIAEEHIPDYVCANNKVLMGAALAGDIPIPDVMVHPSHPCDSNLATYPVMAEYFGFPYFCIDMPYFRNERSGPYVAGELRRLVSFLEEKTQRKLDVDKLKQVMEYSNQAHEYILKISDLRQAVPCPYSSIETISEYAAVLSLAGTPQLVDYLKRRYELTKDRVARKEGHLTKDQEKIRLVWIYGAPAFDLSIFLWLEKQYGAVSVANMNNNFVMKPVEDISDTDKILRGLAEKVTYLPMTRECGGPWENYVDATIDLCRRYKADAAVFAGHVACKSNWAVMKLVKDKIYDELGIPTLMLEVDLFDPRITSSETIRAKFDDFLELFF
ncbi:MAG: 2-hydroxyacyl-CoA dehydratase [Dehalococcoidia bacterium]|nr:2-hydroxyacyl-CoA dehydratase [Dehalococcoidia bacterium]